MDIDQALEKIYSLKQYHIKLGLENISDLLKHIKNPHKDLKTFHVAGSNGKGSTCSFLASILQEFGFKVGLYTSPHFVRFNERIRINGEEIPDDFIIKFLEKNKKYIDSEKPTFFEITTAIAFQYFKFNAVDYAVIETGLGGRLDATNVIEPEATLITSISYEHTHILGETLEQIAKEKAGIIKQNKKVFLGSIPDRAMNTIIKIAKERNAEIFSLSEYCVKKINEITVKLDDSRFTFFKTGLSGMHQLENASLAIITLYYTLGLNEEDKIIDGINNVVENSGIQGRYEKLGVNSNIIFDAAHNLEGINIFLNLFREEYLNYSERYLLFGAMRDKDIPGMLKLLEPFFNKIYVTSTDYERAASAKEIFEMALHNGINVELSPDAEQLLNSFNHIESKKCIVVLGSIYLLGKIKKVFKC